MSRLVNPPRFSAARTVKEESQSKGNVYQKRRCVCAEYRRVQRFGILEKSTSIVENGCSQPRGNRSVVSGRGRILLRGRSGLLNMLMGLHPLVHIRIREIFWLFCVTERIIFLFLLIIEDRPNVQNCLVLEGTEASDPFLAGERWIELNPLCLHLLALQDSLQICLLSFIEIQGLRKLPDLIVDRKLAIRVSGMSGR